MLLEFAAFSELGPRSINEDRYLAPSGKELVSTVIAIADGMGGAPGGSDAATIAIAAAMAIGANPERLTDVFVDAVTEIKKRGAEDASLEKMGTTLSLAILANGEVHVAHVGDTRIYHIRGSGLNALTEDQTEIAELVRRGIFSPQQALRYPRRNVLLSALTAKGEYEVYRSSAKLEAGDRILLVSDGVHQRVKRGGILNSSIAHDDITEFVQEIKERVVKSSAIDNFTALAVEVRAL